MQTARLFLFLAAAAAFAVTSAASPFRPPWLVAANKDCGWPNGTDTTFHAYDCNTGEYSQTSSEYLPECSADIIQVQTADVLDNSTGKSMYPVDFKKQILIQLNAINSGDSVSC